MYKRAGLTFALIACCVVCLMFVMAASAGVLGQNDSNSFQSAAAQ